MVKARGLKESLLYTHKLFSENPSFGMFYLKWRTTPSPLQTLYLDIEKRYQARLKRIFPTLSTADVEALHALLHGIVTAPFLTEEGLDAAVLLIERGMGKKA